MKGRSRSSRIGMGLSGRMGALVPMGMGITGAGRGEGVMRSARIALPEVTAMPWAGREDEAGLRAVALGAAFFGAALAAALERGAALPVVFLALGAAFLWTFLAAFLPFGGAALRGAFFPADFRAVLAAVFLRFGAAFFLAFVAFAITPSSRHRGRGL
jgi:hypothetical protein